MVMTEEKIEELQEPVRPPVDPNTLPVLYESDFLLDDPANVVNEEGEDSRNIKLLRWGDSLTYAFTGVRGSGKSLGMAFFLADAMIRGKRVFSNMPIAFRCKHPDNSITVHQSEMLDMKALMVLDAGLDDSVIGIDEVKDWLGNREWGSVRNRLINAAINQVRKRHMDLLMTIKAVEHLDKQFRDTELDLEISCRDAHVFNSHIPKGHIIRMEMFDISGTLTGFPGWPGKPPVKKFQVPDAERIWHVYNSYAVTDFFEANAKVRLDLEETVITNKDPGANSKEETIIQKVIDDLIESYPFEDRGKDRQLIPSREVQDRIKKAGAKGNPSQIGKVLTAFGITKSQNSRGWFYNFAKVIGEPV